MKITETENSKNDPAVGSNNKTQQYNQEESDEVKALLIIVNKNFEVNNLRIFTYWLSGILSWSASFPPFDQCGGAGGGGGEERLFTWLDFQLLLSGDISGLAAAEAGTG